MVLIAGEEIRTPEGIARSDIQQSAELWQQVLPCTTSGCSPAALSHTVSSAFLSQGFLGKKGFLSRTRLTAPAPPQGYSYPKINSI